MAPGYTNPLKSKAKQQALHQLNRKINKKQLVEFHKQNQRYIITTKKL